MGVSELDHLPNWLKNQLPNPKKMKTVKKTMTIMTSMMMRETRAMIN